MSLLCKLQNTFDAVLCPTFSMDTVLQSKLLQNGGKKHLKRHIYAEKLFFVNLVMCV